MILVSFLLAVLAVPWKAVARPARAVFAKAIGAIPGKLSPVHAVNFSGGHQSLVYNVKPSMVLLPLLYNNADDPFSKYVDMAQYEFAEFWILIGATDVTVDAVVNESTSADGSGPTTVSGGTITQVAGTGDNRMVVVSVRKSTLTKRYLGIQIVVSSATGANVAVLAIRYGKSGLGPEELEAAGANSYLTAEVITI